tara:strand:- start:205 stop:819 length:615 start_codon:yes stop_codon:yes gene_type:complete
MIKKLFFVVLLSFTCFSLAQDSGTKYIQISDVAQTQHDKIVIYEFFWYGCPHCFNIEPTINKIESNLEEDTILIKVPVALRPSWLNHAKAYYAIQQMKLDDILHEKIFEEIHLNNNRLDTKNKLEEFIEGYGFDKKKFSEYYDSFGTEIRERRSNRLAKQYQINSVPTLVVNGKYLTSGSYVSEYDELYNVVFLLVEKERQNKK